jgi:hypothetical protein
MALSLKQHPLKKKSARDFRMSWSLMYRPQYLLRKMILLSSVLYTSIPLMRKPKVPEVEFFILILYLWDFLGL